MTEDELKSRTKQFAIESLRLARSLPGDPVTAEMARQLVRSACSVGANYRASCRGRSGREFIAKLGIVEEETDETAFWLEVLVEEGVVTRERARGLLSEADQLLRIVVASIRTARRNLDRP